jgi:tetratricopeptide (TPR) repeat protein
MFIGRHDEAIREGQKAEQLDPVSSATQASLGWFFYRARRYEEALPHLQRALELEPRSIVANSRLGILYTEMGRYDEAIATFERHKELAPFKAAVFIQAGIARVYALTGRQRQARQMISGLKTNPFGIAAVYAALGDKGEAFRILEKAIAERREPIVGLKEDPQFDNLHFDPRWMSLLSRMNFPE